MKMMFKWTYDFEKNREKFKSFLDRYRHKLIRETENNFTDYLNTIDNQQD